MFLFKKNVKNNAKNVSKKTYNKETQKPVLKCSICNGEQVAGFQDIHTGKFEEVMFIRNPADLADFGYTGALKAPVRCFGNHLSGQRKSQFRTDNECGGAAILKDRTSRMVSLIGC